MGTFIAVLVIGFFVYKFLRGEKRSNTNLELSTEDRRLPGSVTISASSGVAEERSGKRIALSVEQEPHLEGSMLEYDKVDLRWATFLHNVRFTELEAVLSPLRSLFLSSTTNKSIEEKRSIIALMEFPRVRGQLVFAKKSNQEKDWLIQLLEYSPESWGLTREQKCLFFQVGYPDDMHYFRFVPGIYNENNMSISAEKRAIWLKNQIAVSFDLAPVTALLKILSSEELKGLAKNLDVPTKSTKAKQAEAILEKGVNHKQLARFFDTEKFLYVREDLDLEPMMRAWQDVRTYCIHAYYFYKASTR